MSPPAPHVLPSSFLAYAESSNPQAIARSSEDFRWDLDAPGVVHGAFLVERMRSYGGRFPLIDRYQERLIRGAHAFGLHEESLSDCFRSVVRDVMDWNATHISLQNGKDVGLAFVVTPDDSELHSGWRAICYLTGLPYPKMKQWYANGMPLGSSSHRYVPDACVSAEIKHRSRLHYYLADRQVRQSGRGEAALLQSINGFITDTSVANILLVDSAGRWSSPLEAHRGVTLREIEFLLVQLGIRLEYRDHTMDEMLSARERILVGTTAAIWSVSDWNGQSMGNQSRESLRWLQSLWSQHVGCDFVFQANNA